MTEPDDGFDADKKDGKWRWTYSSPGGASWQGPGFTHKSKAAAIAAGREWLKNR